MEAAFGRLQTGDGVAADRAIQRIPTPMEGSIFQYRNSGIQIGVGVACKLLIEWMMMGTYALDQIGFLLCSVGFDIIITWIGIEVGMLQRG